MDGGIDLRTYIHTENAHTGHPALSFVSTKVQTWLIFDLPGDLFGTYYNNISWDVSVNCILLLFYSALCNGECGSKHPHSQVYDESSADFTVV